MHSTRTDRAASIFEDFASMAPDSRPPGVNPEGSGIDISTAVQEPFVSLAPYIRIELRGPRLELRRERRNIQLLQLERRRHFLHLEYAHVPALSDVHDMQRQPPAARRTARTTLSTHSAPKCAISPPSAGCTVALASGEVVEARVEHGVRVAPPYDAGVLRVDVGFGGAVVGGDERGEERTLACRLQFHVYRGVENWPSSPAQDDERRFPLVSSILPVSD
ncbi:hypothetical protein DFH09DRAFT_1355629 [Mycena vulgaris]|nr:hypothetical protein DFH09DRAFT_1355629 [Mycena vulgaris]